MQLTPEDGGRDDRTDKKFVYGYVADVVFLAPRLGLSNSLIDEPRRGMTKQRDGSTFGSPSPRSFARRRRQGLKGTPYQEEEFLDLGTVLPRREPSHHRGCVPGNLGRREFLGELSLQRLEEPQGVFGTQFFDGQALVVASAEARRVTGLSG